MRSVTLFRGFLAFHELLSASRPPSLTAQLPFGMVEQKFVNIEVLV